MNLDIIIFTTTPLIIFLFIYHSNFLGPIVSSVVSINSIGINNSGTRYPNVACIEPKKSFCESIPI